jgi:hypothetical protein
MTLTCLPFIGRASVKFFWYPDHQIIAHIANFADKLYNRNPFKLIVFASITGNTRAKI